MNIQKLFNLVRQWEVSESHQARLCAEQLEKVLLKERLSEWNKQNLPCFSYELSTESMVASLVPIQFSPYAHLETNNQYDFGEVLPSILKEQVSYD